MFIEFKKQLKKGDGNSVKFTVLIKYKKIDFDCQTWLDVEKNILMSPNHPNSINCSWLITSNFESYIILNFAFTEVKEKRDFFILEKLKLIESYSTFNDSLRMNLTISRFMMVVVNMQTL